MRSNLRLTEAEIARRLDVPQKPMVEAPYPPGFLGTTFRPAAVLIPILIKEARWHILYIRRTSNNNDPHSGQVAFPGGACDPNDSDAEATALREAYEEIGLLPEDVRILGHLGDFITVTSFLVTPVIGVIPWPYLFKLQTDEVSRAFTIPLEWLANPANHEIQDRPLPPPYDPIPVIYFRQYDGETLWGASARFTLELIKRLVAK